MLKNEPLALKTVIVTYGIATGSSGIRQALANEIPLFRKMFPSVEVHVRCRRTPTMSITGVYRDGSERSFSLFQRAFAYSDKLSPGAIAEKLRCLASDTNMAELPFNKENLHQQRTSVQGTWNPWLWIAEGHELRKQPVFDTKLTPTDWDHYVAEFSKDMASEENAIYNAKQQVERAHRNNTVEIKRRWLNHAAKSRQTDMEYNLKQMKKASSTTLPRYSDQEKTSNEFHTGEETKGIVSNHENSLFHTPDYDRIAAELKDRLRGRDIANVSKWWEERKNHLKPP